MSALTTHAVMRALERYRLNLTQADGREIIAKCKSGASPCMRRSDHGRIYIVKFADRLLITALHPTEDVIITFMPRDYFSAGSSLKRNLSRGIGKQKSKPHVAAQNVTYSRAKAKRELERDE